jgi:hypothetical protein
MHVMFHSAGFENMHAQGLSYSLLRALGVCSKEFAKLVVPGYEFHGEYG